MCVCGGGVGCGVMMTLEVVMQRKDLCADGAAGRDL